MGEHIGHMATRGGRGGTKEKSKSNLIFMLLSVSGSDLKSYDLREWDSSSCSCKCRSSPLECAPGLHWDSSNCRCHRWELIKLSKLSTNCCSLAQRHQATGYQISNNIVAKIPNYKIQILSKKPLQLGAETPANIKEYHCKNIQIQNTSNKYYPKNCCSLEQRHQQAAGYQI